MLTALFMLGVGWLTIAYMTEGQHHIVCCPSKWIWHWPCPTCGTTRAFLHLLRGEVGTALWQNPNVLPAAAFLFGYPVVGLYGLFTGRRIVRRLFGWIGRLMEHRWVFIVILAVEAVIWVHNIYIGN